MNLEYYNRGSLFNLCKIVTFFEIYQKLQAFKKVFGTKVLIGTNKITDAAKMKYGHILFLKI